MIEIHSREIDKEEFLSLAAHAESFSSHPVATSLLRAYGRPIDQTRISDIQEIPGKGVVATIDGRKVSVGNDKFMDEMEIHYDINKSCDSFESCDIEESNVSFVSGGTFVHLAVDGVYAGYMVIADRIKNDARQAILNLKASGVKKTAMLTGDIDPVGKDVAARLGIDEVHTQLLPQAKMERIEELMTGLSKGGRLVYAGDGINDAPVLARADVGIAMGGLGADAAIEAADVVIMTDEPSKIGEATSFQEKP